MHILLPFCPPAFLSPLWPNPKRNPQAREFWEMKFSLATPTHDKAITTLIAGSDAGLIAGSQAWLLAGMTCGFKNTDARTSTTLWESFPGHPNV